jgi:hypothetical protein
MSETKLLSALAAGLLFGTGAMAASITPAEVTKTIKVGETFTVNKTITLDPTGAGVVDIFFLADNTGSMGGVINNVKSVAGTLLSDLNSTYASANFGVGRYLGDPREGVAPTTAYQLQQAMSASSTTTQTAINAWFASGGGDLPEANFFALHQVATSGAPTPGNVQPPRSTGFDTGWRTGAVKVILWFGDAPSHTDTITEAQTIDALKANNVIVMGFNSSSNNTGMDSSFGGDSNQCDDVTNATGGTCFHNFASQSASAMATTIKNAIGTATSTLDLVFGHTFVGDGLSIALTCTDPLGCDDVAGGESRTFDLTVTGLKPGTYTFEVFANGVSAKEIDKITVVHHDIPEPATLGLLGLGLLGLGLARRRGSR